MTEASENLGLVKETLREWVRKAKKEPGLREGEAEELKRLRVEVRRLKMEREILKKAAAFFAKENQ